MKLLPKSLAKGIPAIGKTEKTSGRDKTAHVKFFHPWGRATWYVTEYDGADECFGYVISPLGSDCDEWGYFSISELESITVRGLGVERDISWTPSPMGPILDAR